MKYLLAFLTAVSACFGEDLSAILPDPYPEVYNIEPMPYLEHGWYDNARQMADLIRTYPVKNVVEVGSWLGVSTRHIAKLLPEEGIVIAVDHWKGSDEHINSIPKCKELLPTLYKQFLSNVIHAQLVHKIIPFRCDSISASKTLQSVNIIIDLVYLDGDHSTRAVYEDLNVWFPYVKNHGIMCGDDWGWETVRIAVKQFASENNLRIHADGNFWYLMERRKSLRGAHR